VVAVGLAVLESSTRDYAALQRRLLLHAQACSGQIVKSKTVWSGRAEGDNNEAINKGEEKQTVLDALHLLGNLYTDQSRLGEAEQVYERALRGYEAALGSDLVKQYRPALSTLENLGDLYALQADIAKAQAMYARALSGLSSVLSRSSERCMNLAAKIDTLPPTSGEREGQSKLPTVGQGSALQRDRRKKSSRVSIRKLVRKVF
jgi:tetratricopeptide (TPR) repeat protein